MERLMKKHQIRALLVTAISMSLLTGFGFSDLTKAVMPDTDKCKSMSDSERKKCEKNETMKSVGKVAVVAGASALVYNMAVSFKTEQTSIEATVISNYKKTHASLPNSPVVTLYSSNLKPGKVVKVGKEISIVSTLEVVPGKNSKKVSIQEKLSIYDNEDNSKVLKTLTKNINSKTQTSGSFKNEFRFTLPIGMPQGIYPIKTVVILDKKEQKSVDNTMQLVLKVDNNAKYRVLALNIK